MVIVCISEAPWQMPNMFRLYYKNASFAPCKGSVSEDRIFPSLRSGGDLSEGIGGFGGSKGRSGDDVLLPGQGYRLGPAGDSQLGEYVAYVEFGSGKADHQLLGDVCVGEALGQ